MSVCFCPKCGAGGFPRGGRCPRCGVYIELSGMVLIILGVLLAVSGLLVLSVHASVFCAWCGAALIAIGVLRAIRQHRLPRAGKQEADRESR